MTKTITLDVSACFGGLDHLGVTKQLLAEAGVQAVTPNPGSTSVIVRFDETVTSVAKRRKVIAACGQHCRGEATPRHVCTPEDLPDGAMPAPVKREPHAGHDKAEMATEIKPAQDHAVDDVLRAAATLERGSDHPLAVGLVNCGAQAEIGEALIYLANRRLMHEQKIDLGLLGQQADLLRGDGRTVVHVAQGGKILGLIPIADAVRPSAKATVAKLREGRVQVVMLTVDNANTAQHIAEELGIDIVLADVLPGQQTDKKKELQAQGKKVAMIGDGVHDGSALTQADVGLRLGLAPVWRWKATPMTWLGPSFYCAPPRAKCIRTCSGRWPTTSSPSPPPQACFTAMCRPRGCGTGNVGQFGNGRCQRTAPETHPA